MPNDLNLNDQSKWDKIGGKLWKIGQIKLILAYKFKFSYWTILPLNPRYFEINFDY